MLITNSQDQTGFILILINLVTAQALISCLPVLGLVLFGLVPQSVGAYTTLFIGYVYLQQVFLVVFAIKKIKFKKNLNPKTRCNVRILLKHKQCVEQSVKLMRSYIAQVSTKSYPPSTFGLFKWSLQPQQVGYLTLQGSVTVWYHCLLHLFYSYPNQD